MSDKEKTHTKGINLSASNTSIGHINISEGAEPSAGDSATGVAEEDAP
ncbi:hypothetical protein JCM19232_1058 [Vibrio ishigakensis]|uniref:Uncharacterized protein n=1 Tax=Vibrio ishigakensis TaxID=1481914 RepID=A0A0B8PMK6_9VIBR|nr:hypothetical protein JCM19232_1058 [Vibrio ishigakensis]